MMKRKLYSILIICLVLFSVAGCKTSGKLDTAEGLSALSDMEYLEEVVIHTPTLKSLSSKVKLSFNLDGKQTNVNGTLKMKKDELIQISIVPLLGIEVARIEISKDSILVIDRLNKQYASLKLSGLSIQNKVDLDFNTLQSLFFNEIFLPGYAEIRSKDLNAFSLKRSTKEAHIKVKKSKLLDYDFTTMAESGLLTDTHISHGGYALNWHYDDFVGVGEVNFPAFMTLEVTGTGKTLRAGFNLSRLETEKNFPVRSEIPAKYTRIDTDELLKKLLK